MVRIKAKQPKKSREAKYKLKHNDKQKLLYEFIEPAQAKILIMEQMLSTWQPAAAISARVGIPTKAVLNLLFEIEKTGKVTSSKLYVDGHNKIYFFKLAKYINVMGMKILTDNVLEEVGEV